MTTLVLDVLDGLSSATAIKGPVATVSTSDVTLAGEQTINGVLTDESRVLLVGQTDATENGIWVTSTGDWRRASDFSRNDDVTNGTLVTVALTGVLYMVSISGDMNFGTTEISFVLFTPSTASVAGSRTVIKALVPIAGQVAILTEAGRSGTFEWKSGNYSARVAADTQEGCFLKAASVSAASGAWVRTDMEPLNVRWFGALGDDSTDDYDAFAGMIAVRALIGAGTMYAPRGTYRVSSTILITSSGTSFVGDGIDATIIKGDLSLTPIVQWGNVSAVFTCQHRDMTVTRAAGTVPDNSIGILWAAFNYAIEYNVKSDRSAINRKLTNPSPVSIGWDSYGLLSTNAKTYDLQIINAAQVRVVAAEFGRNGGETYDRTAMVNIIGDANNVSFINCNFIPRGPGSSKPSAVFFVDYTNGTGVFNFVECNTENTSAFITSNPGTAIVPAVNVMGGRYAVANLTFNLNAATRALAWTIAGANFSASATLVNPQWLTLTGNFFGSALSLLGGADAQAVVSGNDIIGAASFTLAWDDLTVVGNNIGGAVTDTTTGSRHIADNNGYVLPAAAITTSASPYTYTAGSTPECVIFSASTGISAVTVGGTSILPAALGANVPMTVSLAHQEAVVITYTGTLTAKKKGA